jgi:histidine triad (HIT) family protein
MKKISLFSLAVLFTCFGWSQSEKYQQQKANKIKDGSVFTKIIKRELPATIVYEDDDIVAFIPLRLQAPVHLLIVPKKEINTINDITDQDTMLLGKLFLVAKKLAKENGIAETGYRTVINCNNAGGQEVYHLHLHLLGGRQMSWPAG